MPPRDAPGLTRGPFRTCAQTLRDTIAQLQTDIESERGNDANHSIKQAIELEKQNEQSVRALSLSTDGRSA